MERHITLDALRGFAVMGILAMNIIAFAMPDTAYFSPAVYGGETAADMASWFFSFIFVDGKMRGLFSLLFGASMLLIIDRAETRGESAARVHFRRMAWLALFGLAHYFLIWFGDILFLYAVIGCVAFLFRRLEADRLIKWALTLYVTSALLFSLGMGGMFILKSAAEAPNADAETVQSYQEMRDAREFQPAYTQSQLEIHRGGYAGIVAHKWFEQRFQLLTLVVQSFLETLPLMLLGMALLRNGFLLGAWDRQHYLRLALWTIPTGALASAVIAFVEYSSGFAVLYVLNAQLAWAILPRLVMTIGYAALLVVVIQNMTASALLGRVAAAGRAAFSNYLGTSIVMTTIFYGYGLGLYGHISRFGLWGFILGAWVIMLLWSEPWLARFRFGPMEWLWRSLARGSIEKMRR
jgi:uncharacterized protein